MHFVLASGELGTLALGLVIASVFGGLIAGTLGIDIGIVIVPVLYHVLALIGVDESLRMHLAVGTSLAAIVPISLLSLMRSWNHGNFDRNMFRHAPVPILTGALVACALVQLASGFTLTLTFSIAALLVALYFAFGIEKRRIAERWPGGIGGVAVSAMIGGVSAATGLGGGSLGVPALTLSGAPESRAIATASTFGAFIAIPGTIAAVIWGWHAPGLPPCSLGYVNLLGMLLIAPVSFLAAYGGGAIGQIAEPNRLRILFALYIVLMTGRMLYDALG